MTKHSTVSPEPDAVSRHDGLAWLVPNATVFVSSACVMVVEIVAGRIVSRHLGASLYTWTSVIGVILGGLAAGNYAGGRLADRFAPRRSLGTLFLVSAAACVAIIVLNALVGGWDLLWDLAWPARVALHVAIVFFLPAAFLGTIGPIATRMALDLGHRTGQTLGSVYACGVVGSLVGTFATGYVLIALMETGAIVWCVAAVLAVTGLAFLPRSRRAWAGAAAVLLAAGLAHADWSWSRSCAERLALREPADPAVLYADESRYSHIEVRRLDAGSDRIGLYLDRLLHSQLSTAEPLSLHYGYNRIFAGVTHALAPEGAPLRTLTIGGGGYVFPRYVEANWPGSRVEVVEIDPAVTRAARLAFGLSGESRIAIHHEDGRVFVNETSARMARGEPIEPYDAIYVDAVNDYSVPQQLVTREFFESVGTLLGERGTLLVNLIDLLESGRMVAAVAATMESVFPHVEVLALSDLERMDRRSRVTFVVAASRRPLPEPADPRYPYARIPPPALHAYVGAREGMVLTDELAPVERLVAPVVLAAAGEQAASAALRQGLLHAERGDVDGFVELCREALRRDETFVEAHYNLGVGLYASGRHAAAMAEWQRAVALDPSHGEAHYNLGAALYEQGRLVEAERSLRAAVRLRPELAAARNALGVVLEAGGHPEEARRRYAEALALDPSLAEASAHLRRLGGDEGPSAGSVFE